MSYTFRIVFSGPCAFVPNRLSGDENPASSWSVLIPELTRGRTIVRPTAEGESRIAIPPHFPAVVFPRRLLASGTKSTALFFRRPPGEEFGVALLDSERLVIRFPEQNRNRQLRPSLEPRQGDRPDFEAGRWSLQWTIPIEDLLAGAGEVRSRDVFDNGAPQQGSLAGHVLLDDGDLYTHSFSEVGGRVSLWAFGDPERPDEELPQAGRPVSYTVALDIPDAEGTVELRFEKPSVLGTITQRLFLNPDPESPDIEVLLSHRELEEVVGLGNVTPADGEFDRDYEAHYTLSAQAEAQGRRLPRLVGTISPFGFGGHRLTCGTSLFEGFDAEFEAVLEELEELRLKD